MTVKRTEDPAGLLPDHIEIAGTGSTNPHDNIKELSAWVELLNRETIGSRVAALRLHPQLVSEADEIQSIADAKWAAGCHPLESDWELRARVAEAELAALYLRVEVPAVRDSARQRGTRKERRPEISAWIDAQLSRNPDAKSPELWRNAPDWITDQIGVDRFKDRVTAARQKGRK